MHPNSRLLFDKDARPYFKAGLRVLEVGPDHPSTLRRIVAEPSIDWQTVDIFTHPELTYTALNEYSFPIADGTYDVVVAANVLKHVRKIWVWIKELSRVCKPGGHVITVNPVSWPYHAIPDRLLARLSRGNEGLYEEGGLEVIVSEWEALADGQVRRSIPGRSQTSLNANEGWKTNLVNRALVATGFPVERAFDIVTIGRKPT